MDIKRFSRKKKDKEDKQRDVKGKDKTSKKEKKTGSVADMIAGVEEAERAQQSKGFFGFGSRKGDRKRYEVEVERSDREGHNFTNGAPKAQYVVHVDKSGDTREQWDAFERDSYRQSLRDRERRNEMKRQAALAAARSDIDREQSTSISQDYRQGGTGVPIPATSSRHFQQASPIIIPNSKVGQQVGLKFKPASNGDQIGFNKHEISETVVQAEMTEELESNAFEIDGYIDGVELQLPELVPLQNSAARELRIRRRPAGDFGFALRRSQTEGDPSKLVHLIEPIGDQSWTGLLPGDRIVEVNGKNVETCSHETIIDMIAKSGDAVTLKVIPVPELAELSTRSSMALEANNNILETGSKGISLVRSSSRRIRKGKAKTEEELVSERAWLDAEKVWVIHSNGFSSARLLKQKQGNSDKSLCRVKLDQNGEIIEVDEEHIEKANPPQYDRAEDLAALRHLNETGCLHTLRQRHGSNLIHTYAGPNLLVVNPKSELGVYTDKVIQMFRGCRQEDMPPHIYAFAQTAYRNMLATRLDQSLVFLGRSGAGKSVNFRHAVHYLTTAAVSPHSNLNAQKMEAALSLLESFGCAKTSLCRSASRFSLLATIEYDPSGLAVGGNLQTYLLEKSRVVQRPPGESNFRIFYELISGCDEKLRKELHLDALMKEENSFFDRRDVDRDFHRHSDKWMELQFALEVLSIQPDEAKGLWAPLAAILHLGAAGISVDASGQNFYFSNPLAVQHAALALGTTEEELARVVFAPSLSNSKLRGSERGRAGSAVSVRSSEGVAGSPPNADLGHMAVSVETHLNALEGFVMGFYVEACAALVRLINRSINTTARIQSSLILLDTPGFQDPGSVHPKSTGGSFEDLCYNYACERLNWFVYYSTFTAQMERYNRENIDCNFEMEETVHPDVIISTFDRLNVDRRLSIQDRADSKGIFWILEDESMRAIATPESIVEKIRAMHMTGKVDSIAKRGPSNDTFWLAHSQSTHDVLYSTRDWLYKVKEHPTIKMAYTVLAESQKPHVADMYVGHRSGVLQVEIARTRTMKKRSSHGPTIPAVKKNSVCMQIKIQMDSLLEQLRRTGTRFVHCFLPETYAGNVDPSALSPNKMSNTMSVPLIRQQFRSANLLESMRVYRQGYPEYVAYGEFRRRFDILLSREEREKEPVLDEKQAVQRMLEKLDLDKRSYKLGLSQIFLRAGSFAQLEDSRDEKLNDTMVNFQAHCRGLIGRKRLKQKKIQCRAITCLQRNIRKFMAVKNWPWWRLYVKVLPLLDVHRTEEELKSKSSEVATLKSRVDKLEEEKKHLNELNNKLQKKLVEMSSTLSEIQASSTGAHELLDQETAERLRLEEELERIKNEYNRLLKQNEKLETEVLEARIAKPVRSSRDRLDDDDEYSSDEDTIYKDKYLAATREFEILRKKITDQSEEEIQQLQDSKRQVERKLAEEKAESEDLRRALTNTKRKVARLNGEMEDMKLILETSQSRNAELEKKQRKFDQDMNSLRDTLNDEKQSREVAQKERDKLQTDKYKMDGDMQDKDEEIARLKRQVERLDTELQDVSSVGRSDGNEVMNLKRDKRELEMKLQEQEEELDEQAGQIQMLEQAKLKLEMESQKDKQKFQKDLEAKEEEVEQFRADYHRKMRQVEEQLEDEHREKSEAVKVRRELERRVFELQRCAEENDQRSEKRLRKELRKLRALYKDAKYALENQSLQATDKNQLKQLRNQLEDAEYAKHIAIKSKKQLEADLVELQKKLEEMTDAKQDAEERFLALSRDNAELVGKIEEDEDSSFDVIKKNKSLLAQIESMQAEQTQHRVSYNALLSEKDALEDRVRQLSNRLRHLEENMVDKSDLEKAELKIKDIEHKLDNEVSTKIRLENQNNRLKNNVQRLQEDKDSALTRESRAKQDVTRLERQLKEQRDFTEVIQKQETDHKRRKEELESQLETTEQNLATMKVELNHVNKRCRDLQEALEREMASSDDDDLLDDEESDEDLTTRRSTFSPASGSLAGTRSFKSYDGMSPRERETDTSSRFDRKLSALEDEVRTSRTRLSRSNDSLDDDSAYSSRHRMYRKDSSSSTTPSIPEADISYRKASRRESGDGLYSGR